MGALGFASLFILSRRVRTARTRGKRRSIGATGISTRGMNISRWSRAELHAPVLVRGRRRRREGGVHSQELEVAADDARAIAHEVVVEHHVHLLAAEDLEVPLELLREADAVAVEEVLDVDRPRRQSAARAPVFLGVQGLGEIGDGSIALKMSWLCWAYMTSTGLRSTTMICASGENSLISAPRWSSTGTRSRPRPLRWPRLGVAEQPQVVIEAHPPVAPRQVVAEIQRLLVEGHEDLRMPAQALVERRAAAFEGADEEEIGSVHRGGASAAKDIG